MDESERNEAERGIFMPPKSLFFLPTIQIEKYLTVKFRHFIKIGQNSIESSEELQFFPVF